MKNEIKNALAWRYATQVFDKDKKVSDDDINTILESGRLAPSSYGIEAWKFLVIRNVALRTKLKEAGYGQLKITDASHLIVIARRTDVRENIVNERVARTAKIQHQTEESLSGLAEMINGRINAVSDEMLDAWVSAQTYIALGVMIETASLLEIDNGPMEGFVPAQVDEILGLKAKNLTATTMLALGYRAEDQAAMRPKVRREFSDVVEFYN
ncbi:MAG: NAD(P)H-dependent oxidoreductase [bacterium]